MLSPLAAYTATTLIGIFLVIVISSLPLYFAVKALGGKAGILKVFLVNVIVAVLIPIFIAWLGFNGGMAATVLSFIAMLLMYVIFFDLGFIKAFLAWLLQLFFIFLTIWILALLGLIALLV